MLSFFLHTYVCNLNIYLVIKLWDPSLGWGCAGTIDSHSSAVVGDICYLQGQKLLISGDRSGLLLVHDENGGFNLIISRNASAVDVLSMVPIHSEPKIVVSKRDGQQ